MAQKFTAIFQPADRQKHDEQDWLEEIFGPFIKDRLIDGEHRVVRDNAIVFDGFITTLDPSYYEKFKGKNAFLVHLLDETYAGSYQLYQNFRGVYRNHWSSVFNPIYVKALPYGFIDGMDRTLTIAPASLRPYLWSFAGGLGKSTRPDMADALSKVEPHYLFATDRLPDFLLRPIRPGAPARGLSRLQYQRTLLESVFSPSPMGNVNIECYRPYEALECGSIPIVERRLGLDYYRTLLGPHPMPTVRSWPEARALIASLIQSPGRLDALQAECMAWWAAKKAELRDEVGAFLEARSADETVGDRPIFEPRANSSVWRYGELLRHHDLRAIGRRAFVQASRWAKAKHPASEKPGGAGEP